MTYYDIEDDALAYEREGKWMAAMGAWTRAMQATPSDLLKSRCVAMVEHCEKQMKKAAAESRARAQAGTA